MPKVHVTENEHLFSVLLLLKLDAKNLFNRIHDRREEYVREFSLKRQREHFAEIFFNRYNDANFNDLKICDPNIIITLDHFYTAVDDLKWYLNHTQDMTNMVYDQVGHFIKKIRDAFEALNLYIDAQLALTNEDQAETLGHLEAQNEDNTERFSLDDYVDPNIDLEDYRPVSKSNESNDANLEEEDYSSTPTPLENDLQWNINEKQDENNDSN